MLENPETTETATTTATTIVAADATTVATYIQERLTTSTLSMKEAVTTLGWSFPRIRSKAKTIAKKMNGTLVKKARGEYAFQPNA